MSPKLRRSSKLRYPASCIIMCCLVLSSLALLLTSSTAASVAAAAAKTDDVISYNLYPTYPKYCSTPEEMATRAVPPLAENDKAVNSQLVHVTAVIRHGARTPWSDQMTCWDGYWSDPATAIWDCELTTMTSPPSDPFVKEVEDNPDDVDNEDDASQGDSAMFLFEKRYDALHDPPILANAFNGTCQMGQLLLRGYEQELANGKHLRDAYIYSGSQKGMFKADSVAATDPRMRLFDLDDDTYKTNGRPYEEPHLYYRADDEQRTLMSGQVLLRGLWGPEITADAEETGEDPVIVLHTADYKYDVLGSNWLDCPRLEDLKNDADNSDFFQQFNTSFEAKELRSLAAKLGKDLNAENWIDCLMTTMCTDRPLPNILNDYGKAKSVFQRFLDFATYSSNYKLKHNNAAYAKLGMGPLWHEMMANIRPVVERTLKPAEDGGGPPPKLALFSGHDSTIQPLLASLGENVWDGKLWSPYASTLMIEIHKLTGDDPTFKGKPKFMFRLIYNGEALTSRMDGCPNDRDLCDASVLIDWVTPFAKIVDRDCKSSISKDDEAYSSVLATEQLLTTPGGILIFGSMMLLCGFLGSIGTFIYLTGRLPMCCCTRRSATASTSARRRSKLQESYSGISLPDRNGHATDEGAFGDEEPYDRQEHHTLPVPPTVNGASYGSADESPPVSPAKKDVEDTELI